MSIEVNATEQIIEVNATGSTIDINVSSQTVDVNATTSVIEVTASYNPGINLPIGGATGQVLKKQSGTDYDIYWGNDNGVPYIGATGDVDLGEYELKAGQIELDQSPTGTAGVAVTRWNDTIGSTETTLKGGNVVLKNGVDLVARVVNKVTPNTTLTKAAYQAVKVSGAQGQRLAIALAQANNDNNSADTLGLVIETIPTNQEGFIITVGSLEGINTTGSLQGETWTDGDVLYLSPTVAGRLTNIKPNGSTGHIVVIGYVEYAHQNNGKIYVKIMNGWELDELHNVFISSPANNDALIYESATSLWKNKSIATALGYTPGTVSSVALSVPTGLVITSGSPITTSGTIAVGLQSGYSIPTTVKQANWDDAYTFVSNFPTQSGNIGKYLTTDGSTLSWGTVSTANIYNSDGTLTANRTVTMGSFTLSFTRDILVNGLTIGKGGGNANNTAVGVDALVANTTGFGNSVFGIQSGRFLSTGLYNSAFGLESLRSSTAGTANSAFGYATLYSSQGNRNTSFGSTSFYSLSSGNDNTSIGNNSGRYLTDGVTGNTTCNTSIFIGAETKALANNQSNQIVIGHNSTGLGSNTTVIGNSSTTDTAIYGRMLVNYAAPVIGTYALDVNGTGRFTGNVTGGNNFVLPYVAGSITTNALTWGNTVGVYLDNSFFFLGDSFNSGICLNNTNSLTNPIFYTKLNQSTYIKNSNSASSYTLKLVNDFNDSANTFSGILFVSGTGVTTTARGKGGLVYNQDGSGWNRGDFYFLQNTIADASIASLSNAVVTIKNNGSLVVGSTSVSASALLEVVSSTKGFLQPRMTGTQRDAIVSPATGLSVYNTTTNTSDFYNGTSWVSLAAGNIYTADGTLTGNRTVTMGSFTLSFTKDITVNGLTVGKGSGQQTFNTVVGLSALRVNSTGNYNTAFGASASEYNSTGNVNTAFGAFALGNNTTGSNNTAIGAGAGEKYSSYTTNVTAADNSIFIGYRTQPLGNSQTNQIVIGHNSTGLGSNTTVIGNSSTTDTAIYGRMLVNYSTPVIGTYALDVNGTGRFTGDVLVNGLTVGKGFSGNTALGVNALLNVTTGINNTAIGNSSLGSLTTGNSNTAITGLANLTTGSNNVAIGLQTLNAITTQNFNTAVGYQSMMNTTGVANTAVGFETLQNNSTNDNVAIGYRVLRALSTGAGNTSIGSSSMTNTTTGSGNSSCGVASLLTNTTGSRNTALGDTSGAFISGGSTSALNSNNSIFIGYKTYPLADNQTNQIVIGYQTVGLGSNTTVIGNSSTTLTAIYGAFISGATSINASAQLQIDSTTKGFLPPRMTETQKNAISTPAAGLIVYQTDGTEGLYERTSTAWRIINASGGGSGITRSVNNISTTTTAAAAANTDYVYLISGTTTLTLPTAAGNTNRYTLKNVGTGTVTINTTSSQTIDGSTSITMAVQYTALDVISDGTNWNII